MATFRKRGNKWSFRIDIGKDPVTGKRQQKTVSRTKEFPNGFFTKKEAQQAAAQMEYELAHGMPIQESEIIFRDLVERWLKHYQKEVKISTLRARKKQTKHLLNYFGHMKSRQITKTMYQDALFDLIEKYAENTVDGIHSTGRMIFKYAMKYDLIKVDPTQYAKVPRIQKTVEDLENEINLPKFLEKEELAIFLEAAKIHGLECDYPVFLLLAYSGIRVGELCGLKDTDLDYNEHTISINRTYYNPKSNVKDYHLLTPKTKKSVRTIEIEEVVLDEIKRYQTRRNEMKMAYRNVYHDNGFLFVNFERYPGYPIYIKLIEGRMKRLLKIAGLDTSLTPHSLRHTHTSLCAEAGASLEEIMDRLGHKDDDTTRDVYLHITKARKKEVSKKFGNLMRNVMNFD